MAHWNRHSGGMPFPERIGFQNGCNVEIAITINANQTQRRRHGRLSLVTIRIQAVWQKAMDSPEMGFRFRRVSFSDKNLSRRYVAFKCSSSCRSRCRTKDSTSFLDNPQVNGSFFHRSQALVNQRNPSNPGLPAGG